MGHSCCSKYNEVPKNTSCPLNCKRDSWLVQRDPPASAHLVPGLSSGIDSDGSLQQPSAQGNGAVPLTSDSLGLRCLWVFLEQGNTFSSCQSCQGIKSTCATSAQGCVTLCVGLWQDKAHMLLEMFHIRVAVDHFPIGNASLEWCYMAFCPASRAWGAQCDGHCEGTAHFWGENEKEKKKVKDSALANINSPTFS